jgi:two-component system response regulator AtoC
MQPAKDVTILLAEDDLEVRHYLELALRCEGYEVETADDGEQALRVLRQHHDISAALLDIVMPRRDGLETLKDIKRFRPMMPVIIVSGASSPLNVVDAMKNGATDFLGKPVSHSDLRRVVRAALEPRIAEEQPQPAAPVSPTCKVFFGQNPMMAEIRGLLAQIGWSDAPALILGETGVGKEVLARELHANSPRSKKLFLKVNCAALPSELVESELFGYERGAFTGAFQKKAGMFELADGGTIFLDEIGDMDFKLQAKLLQVLQDSEFQRLGGKDIVHVDVRVIAATHKNLEMAMAQNTFREDLYYRLNVVSVSIPPLRDRKEDLLAFTEHLLQKHGNGAQAVELLPSLRDAMFAYDWPGNIRELENIVRKLLIVRDQNLLVRELRARIAAQSTSGASAARAGGSQIEKQAILEQVQQAKDQAETAAIVAALDSTHWNRKKAASLLKIDYKALLYKMKKLSIDDRMAMLPHSEAHVNCIQGDSE